MKFFFDNNISFRVAYAIRELASFDYDQVEHVKDKFGENALDETWIPGLASDGPWVVLSGDKRLRKNPEQRRLLRSHHLTTFFMSPGWHKAKFWDRSIIIVRWWPMIRAQVPLAAPGSLFEITLRTSSGLRPYV